MKIYIDLLDIRIYNEATTILVKNLWKKKYFNFYSKKKILKIFKDYNYLNNPRKKMFYKYNDNNLKYPFVYIQIYVNVSL